MIFILVIQILMLLADEDHIPTWVRDSTKMLSSNKLQIACIGTGPDISSARKDALHNCLLDSQSFLQTDYTINSTSIETESDVAYHSAISANMQVHNIRCNQVKEEINENHNNVKVYKLCLYNLKEVVTKTEENKKENNISNLGSIKNTAIDRKYRDINSTSRLIYFSTIPICSSILIKGKNPKIIKCNENPVGIVISPDDTEIIFRSIHKLPKTILANEILENKDESFQVIFD